MIKQLYEPFQRWSGTVWVYSDPHFADDEMKHIRKNYIGDDEQVARINSKVGRADTLILLGDIGDVSYLEKLRGHKVLILGNHDKGKSAYAGLVDESYSGPLFVSDRLLLSHEPINLPFAFNIHGHDHSGWHEEWRGMNVCAELIDYTPINLTRLVKNGLLAGVPSIHRMTIDKATEKKG